MAKKIVKKENKMSTGKKVAIGASLAALGVGAYYLLGPDGKKNQKKVVGFMTKMKKEVEKEVKKVKDISEPIYHKTVDSIAKNYAKQYKEHAPQIKAFVKHLKNIKKTPKPKKAKTTKKK